MENLNKNWLLILLVAVIFGTLGFLVGRTTGDHDRHAKMMWVQKGEGPEDSLHLDIKVDIDDLKDVETIEKTDTIMKDGKQIIIKEVKKVKK